MAEHDATKPTSVLERIPGMNQVALEKLLRNARERQDRPDAKAIIEACEIELLKYQPKVAFHRRAREVMEEVGARHGLLKLPNNSGKSGVLDGGGMRAGWLLADYYVGFKCRPFRRQAVLSAVIRERDSDLEFWVYDLDHTVVRDGKPPEWLPEGWDLGIPILRTYDADEAAEVFKEIIAPHVGGAV